MHSSSLYCQLLMGCRRLPGLLVQLVHINTFDWLEAQCKSLWWEKAVHQNKSDRDLGGKPGFEGLNVLGKAGTVESTRSGIRWHIIHTHKAHPDWSFRQVGTAVGVAHKTVSYWLGVHKRTGNVKDQPRSGRRPILTKSAVSKIRNIAINKHATSKFSASKLSQALQAQGGATASARSVCRNLKAAGWKYGYAKRVLMLSPSHRTKRLAWARKHLSKRTAFSSWMFSDSKVFLLHRAAGKAGVKMWYPQDCTPSSAIAKRSKGLHVYVGVTKFGATKPIFVTGGGSQKSRHIDPKTDKPFVGVGMLEYQQDILPLLLHGGNMIFAANSRWGGDWKFRQDIARPHTAASTVALLKQMMPGRVELQWPAMSLDLSWVENVWAWAERQLATKHPNIQTIPQLKSAIKEVFDHVPLSLLQNHVRGMHARLVKVVQKFGANIG